MLLDALQPLKKSRLHYMLDFILKNNQRYFASSFKPLKIWVELNFSTFTSESIDETLFNSL